MITKLVWNLFIFGDFPYRLFIWNNCFSASLIWRQISGLWCFDRWTWICICSNICIIGKYGRALNIFLNWKWNEGESQNNVFLLCVYLIEDKLDLCWGMLPIVRNLMVLVLPFFYIFSRRKKWFSVFLKDNLIQWRVVWALKSLANYSALLFSFYKAPTVVVHFREFPAKPLNHPRFCWGSGPLVMITHSLTTESRSFISCYATMAIVNASR